MALSPSWRPSCCRIQPAPVKAESLADLIADACRNGGLSGCESVGSLRAMRRVACLLAVAVGLWGAALGLRLNGTACPDYADVPHGWASLLGLNPDGLLLLEVSCELGFDLEGASRLLCINEEWKGQPAPQCVPRCRAPPNLPDGSVSMEPSPLNTFPKGTVAEYACRPGWRLSPPESKLRVCERGLWTGADARCVPEGRTEGCRAPEPVEGGYIMPLKEYNMPYAVGNRVRYECAEGRLLVGPYIRLCTEAGEWSPSSPPRCQPYVPDDAMGLGGGAGKEALCPLLPGIANTNRTVKGKVTAEGALHGTEVLLACAPGFREEREDRRYSSACQFNVATLFCHRGKWRGNIPQCVPTEYCEEPVDIPNGYYFVANQCALSGSRNRYPIGSTMEYKCFRGFGLRGQLLVTCTANGCWDSAPPVCYPDEAIFDYMDKHRTIAVALCTAGGVMFVLLVVCIAVLYHRRKPWARPDAGARANHASISVREPAGLSLPHDPDRLALIACADERYQSGLPTYEEATRDRGDSSGVIAGFLSYRPYRPRCSGPNSLRRGRSASNQGAGDFIHITRQSSCNSHNASSRSTGDPMGSTDTMTPSEVSTNVTLDTVSSHSGSQAASCRAICGSLASFDTSSVLNTEGVPLLEENESEDTSSGDNGSVGMEHLSISDSASFKYRRQSPDLV